MEEFKKDLLSMGKRAVAAPIVVLIISFIIGSIGLIINKSECDTFDPYSDTGYVTLDFTVLYGPFAQKTQNGKVSSNYYAAEGSDGYLYVLKTGKNCKYPVYGDTIQESDLQSLPVIKATGSTSKIETKLASYLVSYFKEAGLDVTYSNYSDYFGTYLIDTTDTPASNAMFFYFGAGIFLILAIISFFGSGKKHKLIKKKIEMLERDGLFEEIFTDFSSSNRMFSKKLKLAMAPHFILDFSAPNTGFNVIPLQNVNNVFKCNMLNGRPTVTNYIALENTDGNRYVFAPSDKITPEFESVIGQLKNMINGGAL